MDSVSHPVTLEACVESTQSVEQRDMKPTVHVLQDTLEIHSNSAQKFSSSASLMATVEEDMSVLTINARTSMNVSKKLFRVDLEQSVRISQDGSSVLVLCLFLEMLMVRKDVDLPLQSVSMMPTVQTTKDAMQRLANALNTVLQE